MGSDGYVWLCDELHHYAGKGYVGFDSTLAPTFRVCPAQEEAYTPTLEVGDGYAREIEHFSLLIQGERPAEITTIQQSRDSVRIVEAERKSAQCGGEVSLVESDNRPGR